jgi:large subunit ribosomal protein L3
VAIELLCRKLGMTRIYESNGASIGVTVLEAGSNTVVQKKTPKQDGYSAVQLGSMDRRPSTVSGALRGHFEKAGVAVKRHLVESRVATEELDGFEVGQELGVDLFEAGQTVDVIGTSKGRGTAGVIKRHGFKIHTEGHGTHESFRHGGAIGAGSYPGRVFKGMKMPGRMGNERVTTRNVRIVRVDPERKLLYVRGSVPGHRDGVVRIRSAVSQRS